jgi:hypothetical protein
MKTSGFHGRSTPGTSSLTCGRLVLTSLLAVTMAGGCRPASDRADAPRGEGPGPAETAGTSRPGSAATSDRVPEAGRKPRPETGPAERSVDSPPLPSPPLPSAASSEPNPDESTPAVYDPIEQRPGIVRLSPIGGLWIDPARGEVIVAARVSLTEGPIELFACPAKTKDYESLLTVEPLEFRLDPPTIAVMANLLGADPTAFEHRLGARLGPSELIHMALVMIGLEPGRPVAFVPEYRAASGSAVRVRVRHRSADGSVETIDARDWIRDIRTGGSMESGWVFAGSTISRDPTSGVDRYEADAGDLICVSNFQTALLDLPVPSAQSNEALVFEVMPGRVPAKGTQVEIVLSADSPAVTDEGEEPRQPRREP